MKSAIILSEVKRKRKSVWLYYVNVDRHTIQGRMTLGFLMLALLAAILVLAVHLQWKATMKKSKYSLTIASATCMYAHQFRTLSDEAVDRWKNTNGLQDYAVKVTETTEGDPFVRMQIAKDTMNKLSALWFSAEQEVVYKDILTHVDRLKDALQWQVDSLNSAHMVLKDEIEPARQHITKQVLALVKIHSAYIDEARADLAVTERRLNWMIPLYFLIAFIASCFTGFLMIFSLMNRIKSIRRHLTEIGKGNLPPNLAESKDEMNNIIREINTLVDNLREIQNFALYVGKGDFEKNIKVFNDEGDLGVSLSQMRTELKKVSEEDRQRSWANEGFAHFSEILRSSVNTDELADRIVTQMVKYLHANQGGLFVLGHEGSEPVMVLRACYAYDRKKHIDQTVESGQGLVGQAWLEAETIYLREIPVDYVRITSGLGEATPRFVLILPLKLENKVEGVIELASFRDFLPHEILFAEKVAESIASTLASSRAVENTRRLLEESENLSEQFKAQEEEVRQNMEELAATQEEMHRTQMTLTQQCEKLENTLADVQQEKESLERVVETLRHQLAAYQQVV